MNQGNKLERGGGDYGGKEGEGEREKKGKEFAKKGVVANLAKTILC